MRTETDNKSKDRSEIIAAVQKEMLTIKSSARDEDSKGACLLYIRF